MRNCPVAPNWPKSHFATVVLLKMGDSSYKAKTCPKHRAQPCCCSKLAPSQTAQLSFCFKLARLVRKLKLVRNFVRNSLFLKNLRQNTLRNCRFSWKVKLEENTVRIFPVAPNWRQNTLRNYRFA